jgi:CheY-like chemotaxis protein
MAAPDLRGFVVMVVDEHDDSVEMFKHVLKATGAIVVTARSASPALAILGTVIPSVVVTNIELPDMDGFSFIAELRKTPATRTLPMIAMTGVPLDHQPHDWKEAGFWRAVVTPVDPFVICSMIVEVINEVTATKVVLANHKVNGEPLPLTDEPGTVIFGAVRRLRAAARASRVVTRRLRAQSRDICDDAVRLRNVALDVVAERRTRAPARAS